MRVIELTRGQVAIVDDEDFDHLAQYRWHCTDTGYAARTSNENGKYKAVYMHRFITQAPKGMEVDHINMNKVDNRRCNLRVGTSGENKRNKPKQANNTSGFKGVFKNRERWSAALWVKRKKYHLGTFDTPEEASLAYNAAAIQHHGEFAHINSAARN